MPLEQETVEGCQNNSRIWRIVFGMFMFPDRFGLPEDWWEGISFKPPVPVVPQQLVSPLFSDDYWEDTQAWRERMVVAHE